MFNVQWIFNAISKRVYDMELSHFGKLIHWRLIYHYPSCYGRNGEGVQWASSSWVSLKVIWIDRQLEVDFCFCCFSVIKGGFLLILIKWFQQIDTFDLINMMNMVICSVFQDPQYDISVNVSSLKLIYIGFYSNTNGKMSFISALVSSQVNCNRLLCFPECSTVYFKKATLSLFQAFMERRNPTTDLTNIIMLKDPQQLSWIYIPTYCIPA